MTSSKLPNQFTADQVLGFLDRQSQQRSREVAPDLRRAYRESAAVLAAIRFPEQLVPLEVSATVGAVHALGDELIAAHGRKFDGRLMLAPEVRRTTIKELFASGRLDAALENNPQERTGVVQQQFERYLRGEAKPLEDQSLEELDETHQVVLWLGDALPGVPTERDVQARADYLRLLQPFEAIAGDAIFRGRRKELDQLRAYIGILAPESLLLWLRGLAFNWAKPQRQPALSVSGPGGVGKSALIGRFMLEHTRVPDQARIPFAYLDFDRPGLDIGDPLGLCVEMLRQVDSQFPAGPFSRLRSSIETRMPDLRASLDASSIERRAGTAASILADVMGVVQGTLGPRPYVIVLDTFEEVQYRGEARAQPFWDLLAALQERAPFLRVVISGRAPVTSLKLAGREPYQLEVGDLDRDAAIAFLTAQGVADRAVAEQLVRMVGGVPLSLKLVAALLTRHDEELGTLRELGRRGSLLVSVSDDVIQGQLYERILGHVRDEQVRRLAHPGLVLRRLTPEVILHVLDGPCELGLRDLGEAQRLFKALQRETALVATDDSDGSLVHRADLRRMMLKLLVQSEPARVARIRRAAVDWYAAQGGRRAKAEELYHRLQLLELWSIGSRELADGEVRSSLQASIAELPVQAQVHLATLGLQVSSDILERASLGERDEAEASKVEALLPYGPRSVSSAVDLIGQAAAKLDRPSPLYRAAARAALQNGDDQAARDWIERGLCQSVSAAETRLTLGLLQEKAWLLRDTLAEGETETLKLLGDYAARHASHEALAQHQLQVLAAPQRPRPEVALAAVKAVLDRLGPDDVWALLPALSSTLSVLREDRSRDLVARLQSQVLAEESPFRFAQLPHYQAQSKLDDLLAGGSRPDRGVRHRAQHPSGFLDDFEELCRAWPYRVLHVKAPYGRRGETLLEAR